MNTFEESKAEIRKEAAQAQVGWWFSQCCCDDTRCIESIEELNGRRREIEESDKVDSFALHKLAEQIKGATL